MSYSKRRSTPNEMLRAEIAGCVRAEEDDFTAASIVAKHEFDPDLTLQVIRRLFSISVLCPVNPSKYPDLERDVKMDTVMRTRDFESIRAEGQMYHSWRRYPVYRKQGTCSRCNSTIVGKGRHGKSSRGHTKEVCDLAMIKNLHQE